MALKKLIHFNFVIEDVDAENLFDCIDNMISSLKESISILSSPEIPIEQRDKIKEHIDYFERLKGRVHNSPIKDRKTDFPIHYYIWKFKSEDKYPGGHYVHFSTVPTESAAKQRCIELGPDAMYTIGHLITGGFF